VEEGGVEHRLESAEGRRPTEIEQRRPELSERSDDFFAVLDRACVTAADDHDELASYFRRHSRQRGRRSVEDDCRQFVRRVSDPVSIEAQASGECSIGQ
jgi:hypothetical protein